MVKYIKTMHNVIKAKGGHTKCFLVIMCEDIDTIPKIFLLSLCYDRWPKAFVKKRKYMFCIKDVN